MQGKIFKKWQGSYDGFDYADIYEVVKETPKTIVLRLMKGKGLSSDKIYYEKGVFDTKVLTDDFIEIRKNKNTLLNDWKYEDITDCFAGGDWIFER